MNTTEQTSENKNSKRIKPKYGMLKCIGFMLKFTCDYKETSAIYIKVAHAVSLVVQSVLGLFVAPAILAVIERGGSVTELLATVLAFTVALMLINGLAEYFSQSSTFTTVAIRLGILNLLNMKYTRTSLVNLESKGFQDLQQKAMKAVQQNSSATEAIWNNLSSLLKNILGLIVYVIILSSANVWLMLLAAATSVIGYFITSKLNSYGYKHRDEESELIKPLMYVRSKSHNDSIAKDIRIFGIKDWFIELYDKSLELYTAFGYRCENVYLIGRIVDLFLSLIRNGVAYAYLIYLVLQGNIDVSMFLLYFSSVSGFTTWITGVFTELTTINRQCLEISTILELVNYHEPYKFKEGIGVPTDPDGKYEITLEHVYFKYPQAEEYTLEDINLTLKAGEKLAVVGLNGAGKTTLIKLITGMYDPTEGRVLFNGIDVREFNRENYYEMFSAVFQKCLLWAGTVTENVAQTDIKEDINLDKVKECIEKAGLTEMVESLPNRYDELLNRDVYEDSVNLSGGQLQRLTLARALYKDAPVLVLDEPTAALDPIAEADLYSKYNEMTVGKSSVYISHRLASTRFCDRIILLGEKHIMEEGTHNELLELGGKYAELYEVQSKYYKEGEIDG